MVRFDSFEFQLILANIMAANIEYDIGKDRHGKIKGKVKKIDMGSHLLEANITALDCSGFVRYVVYNATHGRLDLKGGSDKQRGFLEDEGFGHFDRQKGISIKQYYQREAAKMDDHVRIGFRKTIYEKGADGKNKKNAAGKLTVADGGVGHVWLVVNGKTYESTKKSGPQGQSNDGPSSLDWNQREDEVSDLFLLGISPGFSVHAFS
jgi:hypothetical protein